MLPLFFRKLEKYCYLYDETKALSQDKLSEEKNIVFPVVIDTEFYGLRRQGITVQCKAIFLENGKIFCHPDMMLYKELRHSIIKTDFSVIDYMQSLGIDINLKTSEVKSIKARKIHKKTSKEYPILHIDLYAHFALAELLMIFTGEVKKDILNIIKNKDDNRKFEMTRRLRTATYNKGKMVSDYIELPCYCLLNDETYRLKIRIIDSFALHGVASYKDLNANVENELKYKDILSKYDKENMIETYFKKSNDFDNYSLGDLEVYNILKKNDNLMRKVFKSLNIEEYYFEPKLTIGSTVATMFEKVLYHYLGIDNKDTILQEKVLNYCKAMRPENLKNKTDSTECLLAKVIGGRCKNNRILDIFNIGVIVDADIEGAYANTTRNLIYPIGRPVIESYDINNNNAYQTLRQWLKSRKYGKENTEIFNDLFQVIVSNKKIGTGKYDYETLKYSQDLIPSWFDFDIKEVSKMLSDTETIEDELSVKTGKVKILSNQIINGVITSDILEVILNYSNPSQRNELLDNLYVIASCYYPTYSKVNNWEDLVSCIENWEEKSHTRSRKSHKLPSGQVIKVINEPTYWIGLPLGDLLIDNLLSYRKFYILKYGKKSGLQTLFKLINNTIYGVFCSPFFKVSNSLLGNVITAKCRVMIWTMEKSLNMFQSITDGGQVDINRVLYPKNGRKLNLDNLIGLYKKTLTEINSNNMILKPLDNNEKIELFYEDEKLNLIIYKNGNKTIIDNPNIWLNEKLLEHCANNFSELSIFKNEYQCLSIDSIQSLKLDCPIKIYTKKLGLYSIEIKDIYDEACFHGSGNYLLTNQKSKIVKMRSYESEKTHYSYTINDDKEIVKNNFYDDLSPSEYFLNELKYSHSVRRSKAFKKTGILKLKQFIKNLESLASKGFYAGDSIEKQGLLCEFSLSMFTYKTANQLLAIEKEYIRNKNKYAQSYEGFFLNKDGTLNYSLMLKTIENIISQGLLSINKELDSNRNRNRDLTINHPEKILKKYLENNLLLTDNFTLENEIENDYEDECTTIENDESLYFDEDFII